MSEQDSKAPAILKSDKQLAQFINDNYFTQIKNFFGDEKQALKFLSSMRTAVQKTPKLLECEPATVINAFMTMAQLGLMPSDVSGEAYVLPYGSKAQFQLGYQGLITLFYRAGGQGIRAEIVRKNDKFTFINGAINHEIDIMLSNKERGEAVAAYAIATVNGVEITKAMNKTDILDTGKKFSKSYETEYSPWKEKNDPELWMWKKTVLKQLGKLLPKNETIFKAIAADNEESRIKKVEGMVDASNIRMGNFLKDNGKKESGKSKAESVEEEPVVDADSGETRGRKA